MTILAAAVSQYGTLRCAACRSARPPDVAPQPARGGEADAAGRRSADLGRRSRHRAPTGVAGPTAAAVPGGRPAGRRRRLGSVDRARGLDPRRATSSRRSSTTRWPGRIPPARARRSRSPRCARAATTRPLAVEDMDRDGVWAQLCFPTFARFAGTRFLQDCQDRELALACVEAYNDFMLDEWCGHDRGPSDPAGHPAALGRRRLRGRGRADGGTGGQGDQLPREPGAARPAELAQRRVGPAPRRRRAGRAAVLHAHRHIRAGRRRRLPTARTRCATRSWRPTRWGPPPTCC